MEPQNFIDAFRAFYQERPFRQFDIELSSGATLRVDHPNVLAFRDKRAVVLTSDRRTHHLDHRCVVRISSTEEGPADVAAGLKDNGYAGGTTES